MTISTTIRRLLAATTTLALAAGFAAAPVSFDVASSGISMKETKAFARQGRGADDPAGHVRGGGGKGRGGKDDGPNHR